MPPGLNDDSAYRYELTRTLRVLRNEIEHQRTQAGELLEQNRQLREANQRLTNEMNVRARGRRNRSK
jgi:regulator of replication initiation timing